MEQGGHVTDNIQKQTVLLLDGGLGRELRFRGVELSNTIWSAAALIQAPQIIEDIHLDYVMAGADIITANTYGVIRSDLAKAGIENRFAELNLLACELADKARKKSGRDILIAGSLPPLRGSFRADLVGPYDEIEELYREQVEILAPHVDLFLCETMASTVEAKAAATAACKTHKPVWVAWTLHEDRSGRPRSGETVSEALRAIAELPVSGILANCSAPESIAGFLREISSADIRWRGGYANTFTAIPEDWTLHGEQTSDGLLPLRRDLDPHSYLSHVAGWIGTGASVIGGCCGTRPAHIGVIHNYLEEHQLSAATQNLYSII